MSQILQLWARNSPLVVWLAPVAARVSPPRVAAIQVDVVCVRENHFVSLAHEIWDNRVLRFVPHLSMSSHRNSSHISDS